MQEYSHVIVKRHDLDGNVVRPTLLSHRAVVLISAFWSLRLLVQYTKNCSVFYPNACREKQRVLQYCSAWYVPYPLHTICTSRTERYLAFHTAQGDLFAGDLACQVRRRGSALVL